jgi:hypothetical protein
MKAILIDAENKTIKEVEVLEETVLEAIYAHLKVSMIEAVNYADLPITEHVEDVLYVDEEGLINGTTHSFSIWTESGMYRLMGNGLIMGCSIEDGDNAPCLSTVESVKEIVRF